jgi:hypothetical protein
MKLQPIKVQEHVVELEAQRTEHGILFIAKCGNVARQSVMTMNPNVATTSGQHARDVADFTRRLAEEVAGHSRNAQLLDEFFAVDGQPPETT